MIFNTSIQNNLFRAAIFALEEQPVCSNIIDHFYLAPAEPPEAIYFYVNLEILAISRQEVAPPEPVHLTTNRLLLWSKSAKVNPEWWVGFILFTGLNLARRFRDALVKHQRSIGYCTVFVQSSALNIVLRSRVHYSSTKDTSSNHGESSMQPCPGFLCCGSVF